MVSTGRFLGGWFLAALIGGCQSTEEAGPAAPAGEPPLAVSGQSWNFDSHTDLPDGWQAAITGAAEPVGEWRVATSSPAPSAPHVLELRGVDQAPREVFHLLWQPQVMLRDLRLEARIMARTGEVDQGGGVIWRAQDADNYYIARYNPLEENFRMYRVLNGDRQMIASAAGVEVPAGEWFKLRIVQDGNRMQGWLNDILLLEVNDSTITSAGGIGLWTKADAATSFDNIRAEPLQGEEL